MDRRDISRRDLLLQGSATLTGLALLHTSWVAQAFPSRPGEEVIPWLDQPPANPSAGVVENLQPWENLASWLTPNDHFFQVAHYNKPVIDDKAWTLEITGLVKQPIRLTLAALKSHPRQEIVFTLECSGNHGFPWFICTHETLSWHAQCGRKPAWLTIEQVGCSSPNTTQSSRRTAPHEQLRFR